MSKFKISFSLIFTIFLVGMLSTAAFATGGPYEVKGTWNGTGFNVQYNVTDNTQSPTQYKMKMEQKDSSGKYTVEILNADLDSSRFTASGQNHSGLNVYKATVTAADLVAAAPVNGEFVSGRTYQITLTDAAGTTVLEKEYAVWTDAKNDQLLHDGTPKLDPSGNSLTVDTQGSGLPNANETGFGNLSKKRSGQSIHGFYQNNTNSCASCHQTHTAADGDALLFKDGVYSTCSACHDGTTGAANAWDPVTSGETSSIAGTFNVNDGHNGSLHEADGSLNISAAPGGNRAPDSTAKAYSQEFDCASCHAAHGAGSNGENNLSTDPMGWGSIPYLATSGDSTTLTVGHSTKTFTWNADSPNGKLFQFTNADIIDLNSGGTLPTSEKTPYILVKTTADPSADTFWKRANVTTGDLVIQTYRWAPNVDQTNGGSYVKDYSLWNRELGYPYVANTVLSSTTTSDLSMDSDLHIVWKDGFAYGPTVALIDHAKVSIGIDVETTTNIADLYDSTRGTFIADSGTEMSKYCASCHVDYASVTKGNETGVYTTAHRHATLQDRLTCVRCHYAHGSEAKILHDANDNTYFTLTQAGKVFSTSTDVSAAQATTNDLAAISYFQDPNPSSALKRYTGMAVCYACHGKGEQFIGNPNSAADTTTHEFLMGGDPGATRNVISK